MRIVERQIGARKRAFTQTGSHVHGTSEGLPTATAMMAGDGKPKCCYCRQNHPLGETVRPSQMLSKE